MKRGTDQLLKHYLSNVQIELLMTNYSELTGSWGNRDFVTECSKIYYICGGEGWMDINGTNYYPNPGEMLLIPAGVKQSHGTMGDNPYSKYWCHFTATVGDINLFALLKHPFVIQVDNRPRIEALFQELIHYHEDDSIIAVLKVKAVLLELLYYFWSCSGVEDIGRTSVPNHDAVEIALKYMEEHVHDNITLVQLANRVHLHPNYFLSVFKKIIGTSPIKHMNRLKMNHAKQLLATTELSIKEIARSVGMEYSYFCRVFKNSEGFIPSEFRSQYCG